MILFVSMGLTSLIYAQEQPATPQEFLDALVEREETIGVSGGILQDGTIRWSGASGNIDQKGTTPFTAQTPVRIASITKPMTAIAIMQLVEQGKLLLEDPVSKYISAFAKADLAQITVKQLLQHSSGLGAYKNNKEIRNYTHYPTLGDALNIFINRSLEFDPGTAFGYTSYGYTALGMIIETLSGQSYENYLKTQLWEVADMQHTSIKEPTTEVYHQKKPGKINAYPTTDLSDRLPAGGVISTAEDLLKFAKALLNGKLVSNASLNQTITSSGLKKEGNAYGLGWYLYGDNPKLGNIIGHSGAQLGCSAFLLILPDKNAAVTVLANTSRVDSTWNTTMGLLANLNVE